MKIDSVKSTDEMISKLLPIRSPFAHKGSSRLTIIGGSQGLFGAVQLSALAAFSSNCGYVFISAPEMSRDSGFPIEAVRKPLPSDEKGNFSKKACNKLFDVIQGSHAVVIGGGLGRKESAKKLALKSIKEIPVPTVIDADALTITSPKDFIDAPAPRILTPHPGEFKSLFGISPEEIEKDRIKHAVEASKRCGQIVVLKGRPTVTAHPDGRCVINSTGDERLATCGSGDVLAGIIGALLAQKVEPFSAAFSGVHLHGKTVEYWNWKVGMKASDIANLIPKAWEKLSADS